MNKLSAYTIATNCTDITDFKSSIDEINETIQICMKEKRKIPSYYFVRLKKLETKLKRKQTINAKQKLSVTNSVTVSPVGLEMAIRHCLACHIPLTKRNIIKAIGENACRKLSTNSRIMHGLSIGSYKESWKRTIAVP